MAGTPKLDGTTAFGRRSLALTSISIAALMLSSGAAWAQTQTAPDEEDETPTASEPVRTAPRAPSSGQTEEATTVSEVVVTGIRQSLENAQALKRDSDVVSDSISANDIGALPDRSVTEAIQRVPGVSISRFRNGNDPDHFNTEGSGVVIRGLSYTRSEFNGRDTFTANNGRGLSFGDVPSELLAGVDVVKSASADRIEGGISGTVNLRTRRPFDQRGNMFAVTIEQNYSDFIEKDSPNLSALASGRWETPYGQFGLLGSIVRSELYSRFNGLHISNYGARGLDANGNLVVANSPLSVRDVYVPRGAAARTEDAYREREGLALAAQWRSNDGKLEASLQYLRSDTHEDTVERSVQIATDSIAAQGDARPRPGTSFVFDDNGVFISGDITSNNGYRDDQRSTTNARTPITGLKSNNLVRASDRQFLTEDFGANIRWNATDRLSVNFDYQHVESRVNISDFSVAASTFQDVRINVNGSDPADIVFLPVATCPTQAACGLPTGGAVQAPRYLLAPHDSYVDPYNSYYRYAMDHLEASEGSEDAARIDVSYSLPENPWFRSLQAGVRFADRSNIARYSTYNWGVLSEIYGGGGPVWLDENVNGSPTTAGGTPPPYDTIVFDNYFRGNAGNPAADGRLFFPKELIRDYAAASQYLLSYGDEWRTRLVNGCPQNWVPLAQRCGVVAGTDYLPSEINPVDEQTQSIYAMARFDHEMVNGWRLNGNFGLRYVDTERSASGYYSFPMRSYTCAADAETPFCALGPDVVADANAFQNGALTPIETTLDYDYLLPSVNARLNVGGGLNFRFAWNRSISLPDFGLTRAYYNIVLNTQDDTIINNGRPQAIFNVGNPYLRPVEADNLDLTAEYYFSRVGQISLALFAKNLHGVVTNGTERLNFTNNGASFDAIVTTPINASDMGKVRGAEIGYQQTYSFLPGLWSGLGFNANFTYVDASGVRQSTLSASDPDVAAGTVSNIDTSRLPLQGLSKYTLNFQPFYQKGPLELRAAYSWRSRYLLTPRDVIVPFAPIFSEDVGQLDASIFYAVTPDIRIGVQAVNILDRVTETTQVINNELITAPRSWFMSDRRVTFSLRAKF